MYVWKEEKEKKIVNARMSLWMDIGQCRLASSLKRPNAQVYEIHDREVLSFLFFFFLTPLSFSFFKLCEYKGNSFQQIHFVLLVPSLLLLLLLQVMRV